MDRINQNQTPSEPTASPVKKRSSKKLMILIGVIVVSIASAIVFGMNARQSETAPPQENTFYSAIHEDHQVLFFRNKEMHMSGVPAEPHMGRYVSYENSDKAKHHSEDYVDFRTLKDRKVLFTFERYATIENFKLSEDGTYLSMSFLGGESDTINYIYQTNLKTSESKKIWEHKLGTGEAPYNSGTAYITNFVPDRYVVFSLIKGEPAPVGKPGGVIVKNIQNGKEKVLGVVGDVKVDVEGQKVTFKKIDEAEAPCVEKDPQCFATDTYKIVYAPTGEVLTQPLP